MAKAKTTKKKQTRKGISIRGESYRRLKEYCQKKGITMSGWLEEQAALVLGNGKPADPENPVRGGGTHLL
jgi:hypothetical protein